MDWIVVLFIAMLALFGLAIILTLISLTKLGDERKTLIKMKAQSFSFIVVFFMILIHIAKSAYMALAKGDLDYGITPLPFLFTVSLIYLVTLRTFKKKYGD
ncbi:hypothetical protein PGH26_12350 [Sporosarcina jeotgali]|uniref:DUF2178 domain-containing protein n=1 Tax=Sporosarcina jeotgali TaxID=3020056 RepID=A0ABZ0KW66_9BACL|nr:hypothetical protein [Sporosarcina sp. B2O-1]WOV83666.1 hypothetical protein PGH26_12350 [Sporosarcina sp. B2O-1]